MGGRNSGRYPRLGRSKTTVSRCRCLDVNELNRDGLLDAGCYGTARWSRNGEETASIGLQRTSMSGRDALRLHYTITSPDGEQRKVDYRVPLEYTECNFGGERPWFECPASGCDERVGKLYSPPGSDLYLCRHCHDLGYKSSQKSGKHFYENLLKPIERAEAAAETFNENPFDREALRDYYDAKCAVSRGFSQEFGTTHTLPGSPAAMDSFEEWVDRLFARNYGFGWFGQCKATAKTTGERCRQSAVGEHGKCYYHGGARGSGIGEDQRDHAAEELEELLEEVEEQRERDRQRVSELLDESDAEGVEAD